MVTKEIPPICMGFQAYIDRLFWFLPFFQPEAVFCDVGKERDVRVRPSELENWITGARRAASAATSEPEIRAEHVTRMDCAPNDLRVG